MQIQNFETQTELNNPSSDSTQRRVEYETTGNRGRGLYILIKKRRSFSKINETRELIFNLTLALRLIKLAV